MIFEDIFRKYFSKFFYIILATETNCSFLIKVIEYFKLWFILGDILYKTLYITESSIN
jgi:hypothetical protein